MYHLIKKDFLTLSKSKSDVMELLFMPFILIAILGFALGSVLLNNFTIETFPIGIVNEQNSQADLNQLENDLVEEGLPEEVIAQLLEGAEQADPGEILLSLFEDENIEDLMAAVEFEDVQSAEEALDNEEISGFITIPEQFSYDVWQTVYLEEETPAALDVVVHGESGLAGTILESVVSSFSNQYNLEVSVALATDGQAEMEETAEAEHGEIIQLSVEEPINAFQYYTIGMGVMFALSTAPALASRAYKEKEQHVFGRIMLTGTKPMTYLGSKMVSGTLITFVQLVILFAFSTVIFGTFRGRDLSFWMDMFYTTGLYALVVGSITSLITSISLYADNNATANFFGSFVSVFAFLGGSFTPVEQFSESLKQVGNWTPNGAAMTSYLQLMQGFGFQEVLPLMGRVIGMAVVCIVVAVIVFPKRRLD